MPLASSERDSKAIHLRTSKYLLTEHEESQLIPKLAIGHNPSPILKIFAKTDLSIIIPSHF